MFTLKLLEFILMFYMFIFNYYLLLFIIIINMSNSSNNWNDNIEKLLNQIRLNCIELNKHHKTQYFKIKNIVVYFKIPIIVFSSINAITSIGLQSYLAQDYISNLNCGISFIIGILTSISLYLKIEDKLENELYASKEYNKLSIDIFKILKLKIDDRGIDGDQYLNNIYNEYIKLLDRTNLNEIDLIDLLKEKIDFEINSFKFSNDNI